MYKQCRCYWKRLIQSPNIADQIKTVLHLKQLLTHFHIKLVSVIEDFAFSFRDIYLCCASSTTVTACFIVRTLNNWSIGFQLCILTTFYLRNCHNERFVPALWYVNIPLAPVKSVAMIQHTQRASARCYAMLRMPTSWLDKLSPKYLT